MEKSFKQLYDALERDRKISPWSRKHDFQDRFKELQDEVAEVGEAIEKNDLENLKEELGDVLWDLSFLILIGEEKGLFTKEEVVSDVISKFKKRKPWVFKDEIIESIEEEAELYYKNKQQQKDNLKNKLNQ
ncbi:MAG: MazG nucleotide pyrophosphohydrolase domain-containing protein [Patescibacteria group bacterium]